MARDAPVTTAVVCDLTDAALAFQGKMSYAGAQFVTAGHSFRTYGWGEAGNLVDRLLASFSLEATVSGAKQ
ncbi:MAG TPA: hypothetical protein VFJ46_23420 [Xanthobacteraceae bacterium]|nr:hypothetical protein [Xanthobacteraceae bacterium]